jgi:hypothetical protein
MDLDRVRGMTPSLRALLRRRRRAPSMEIRALASDQVTLVTADTHGDGVIGHGGLPPLGATGC